MTELLDDYTKATFPLEVQWNDYVAVRLLAAFDNQVVGVSYYSFERDGEQVEYLRQALVWSGAGIFADGQYPEMNLPPPPAKCKDRVAEIEKLIVETQARLDQHPDAPAEWREADERRLRQWRAQLEKLGFPLAA